MDCKRCWYDPRTQSAVWLVRLAVGLVFFTVGIQKFLFPDLRGVGVFSKIGIPFPQFSAPFVGAIEIIFGFLIIIGLLTKLSTIPLIIDMIVALLATKLPVLLGKGFWVAAYEARLDFVLLLSLIFLLLVGAGAISMDALIFKPKKHDKT